MRKEFWIHSSRGRRPGSVTSHMDQRALEYLAIIAMKHKIDSGELLKHIMQAWEKEESRSNQLIIRCRNKTEDSAIFLFTVSQEVVAQFPIPFSILQGKNQLEGYLLPTTISSVRNARVAGLKIEDLKFGMKHVNLKAKVLEIPEPNKVYTRYGTEAYISNALIGDATGTIRMSLWNNQINRVSKGDTISIENGIVTSFQGDLQLRISKSGSLNVLNET